MIRQFLLIFILCFSFQLQASDWVINRDHSEVLFKVGYLNVSEVTGRFKEFSGKLNFDKNRVPQNILISILTASIDTGHKMRDNHLQANDFFESKQYPEVIFKSSNVKKIKKNEYEAKGLLTIKKTVRPLTINFTLTDSVTDTWGYENKFIKFQSKLGRKEYSLNWNKSLDDNKYLVSDEVDFWGVFQIQPSHAQTPTSKHMLPDTEYIREREDELRKSKDESTFSKKLRGLINGK